MTASALLDVLTAQEAHAIVDACVQAGAPVLLSLSVTGEVELQPPDPRDKLVEAAFNDHQRREVHGRRLLGRYAAPIVTGLFGRAGWNTRKALTTWRLDDREPRLLAEWFEGWVDAAEEQSSEVREVAAAYRALRSSQLARGGAVRRRVPLRSAGVAAMTGPRIRLDRPHPRRRRCARRDCSPGSAPARSCTGC